MIRKTVAIFILVPITIVFVAFAVANRETVVVSLDPFDRTAPALSVAMPLFALILGLIVAGILIGGAAAWLRQGKWRWRARLCEEEARELRAELERLRQRSDRIDATIEPERDPYAPRLTVPPPA
jgi:uncharacterized integral membrane protein